MRAYFWMVTAWLLRYLILRATGSGGGGGGKGVNAVFKSTAMVTKLVHAIIYAEPYFYNIIGEHTM